MVFAEIVTETARPISRRARPSITCAVLGMALCCVQTALSADPRCGSNCLYVALKGLDIEVPDFKQFQSRLPPIRDEGYSLAELAEAAKHFGAHTAGVETNLKNLKLRKPPFACIALLEEGHYVVLADETSDGVTIVDPPGTKQIPASTLGVAWNGEALLVSNAPLEKEEDLGKGRRTMILVLSGVALAVLGLILFRVLRSRSAALKAFLLSFGLIMATGCGDAGLLSVGGKSGSSEPVPLLQVTPPELDLGKVELNKQRTNVEIVVANKGTAPLRLYRVTTTCGCAALSRLPGEIPSGDSHTMVIALDCSLPGKKTEAVIIESDDQIHPVVKIPLLWEPVGKYVSSPEAIHLDPVTPGSVHEILVDVSLNPGLADSSQISMPEVTCSPENAIACAVESAASGFRLNLLLQAGHKREVIKGHIALHRGDPSAPECLIPVSLNVVPAVYIEPESLYLEVGPGDRSSSGIVEIRSGDNRPVDLIEARFPEEFEGAAIETENLEATRAKVRITINPGAKAVISRGKLQIRVREPEEEFLVPVIVFTRK